MFISHKLKELELIADRVTVLRDGQCIATLNYKDTTIDNLICLMVGREINDIYPIRKFSKGKEVLRIENLSRAPDLHDINFNLYEGEILGIAELVGAGRTEEINKKLLLRNKLLQSNSIQKLAIFASLLLLIIFFLS